MAIFFMYQPSPPLDDSPGSYSVPRRFGMSGILGITTFMALLFGLLRGLNAPPFMYLFCGSFAVVMCLVQMRYDEVPRKASALAGAIFLPFALVLGAAVVDGFDGGAKAVISTPCVAVFGAFVGYAAGAFTGGIFLVIDLLEKYLIGGTRSYRPRHVKMPESPWAEAKIVATLVDEREPFDI